MEYGKNKGCDFYNHMCKDNNKYCFHNSYSCSDDYKAKTICLESDFGNDCII